LWGWEGDGLGQEFCVEVLQSGSFLDRDVPYPERVGRNEGLGGDGEPCPASSCLADQETPFSTVGLAFWVRSLRVSL
jgi:hypothetical protein